jgi:glutathione S-transferase
MREIEKHLAILEKYLQGKTFLVAEQFSLADMCYVPFLEFSPLMEIVPPNAVEAWSQRLLARPSSVSSRALTRIGTTPSSPSNAGIN